MRVPRSSRSKPPAEPATPSASSSSLSVSLLRAAAWCAPFVALAVYARSFWGSPAFGALADQGYHLELGRAFTEAWRAGEFPPTWSATANGGRGSPAFLLYPPLFPLLTACWMRALGLGAEALRWAAISAAAFNLGAVYWAARGRCSRPRAALASALALLLPGTAFIALGRGMFPNFLALGWVALAAGAAQRALDGGGWRSLTLLAAAGAGLILTHTPTAYLAALLAAAFLLVHCRPRRVAGALAAGLAALTVTAWFWVPMLQTAREAQTDYLTEAHPYRQSLWMHQDQGAGMFEQDWAFLNGAGAVIGVAQALLAASLLRRRGAAGVLGGLPIVAGMTVAASLWPTGEWLTALPMYDSVQFCWRWQPLLALWCAFAFAAARRRSLILPGAVLACILGLFAPLTFPLKEHGGKAADLASNLIEMRPVGAPRERYPPGSPGIAEVVQGKCGITPERLEPALRVYRVRAKTACTIRIRTFHFSGWTATLDGLPTPIERERKTALQLVRAPRGGGLLELRYRRPTLLGKLTID